MLGGLCGESWVYRVLLDTRLTQPRQRVNGSAVVLHNVLPLFNRMEQLHHCLLSTELAVDKVDEEPGGTSSVATLCTGALQDVLGSLRILNTQC